MKYTTVLHINPKDETGSKKFHPAPVYTEEKTLADLAEEISHASTLTAADIKAVVEELVSVFAKELVRGTKIKIDGLGTFRFSFGGTGHETSDEVTVADIDGIRVVFIVDPKLRKKILASITFEKTKQNKKRQEDSTETNTESIG